MDNSNAPTIDIYQGIDKNPAGVSMLNFDGMPMVQYQEQKKLFLNTQDHCFYDKILFKAGQVITPQEWLTFKIGKTQPSSYANHAASQFNKTELHTNMIEGGEFTNRTGFLFELLGIEVSPSTDKVAKVNGEIQDPTIVTIGAAAYSGVHHLQAIREQFKATFYIDDTDYFDGRLKDFPDPLAMSGAIGASNGGYVQNGFGNPPWNKLDAPFALASNDNFRVGIRYLGVGFTPLVDFEITVAMYGVRVRNRDRR